MVWITYKFARVEQNCGRKGGLSNCLMNRRNESRCQAVKRSYPGRGALETRIYGATNSQNV